MVEPHSGRGDLDATRIAPTRSVAVGATGPHSTPSRRIGRGATVGRYLIVDEIGAGGMGEVFSAYDPELDRRVALKLVKFDANEDAAKARSRLLREAQALAKLSHPNVVAVYDAGTHGDRVFIAMEYVEGRTFSDWLRDRSGREPADIWREALAAMLQAGRGLAAAHAEGLVHRDFKPANMMVSEDGRVRVLDFGLARRFDEAKSDDGVEASGEELFDSFDSMTSGRGSLRTQLTQTGMVMGTPAYMAPEQFSGGSIDARTDQFSFCIVLFRGLFGIRPFAQKDFAELSRAVKRGELREMPKSAKVPRAIAMALRRGLSVNREDRYPTMDALLGDLERGVGRGRRRLFAITGGAALLAGIAATTHFATNVADAPTPCRGAETKLEQIWDEERRQAMASAFEATALAYAEDAHQGTRQSLDEYTGAWIRLHGEICEATRVRGDQSEALMDLRIGCLDGKLRDVSALVTVLTEEVDASVVKNAALGVQQLPTFNECSMLERDESGLLRPGDPQIAAQVEEARELIAAARARVYAGKYDDALVKAHLGLEMAERSDYLPLLAEAHQVIGRIQDRRMSPKPTLYHYEEALYAASASDHTRIEAIALAGLVSVTGTQMADLETSLRYSRYAMAVAQRLGNPPQLEAGNMLYRGNAYMTANEFGLALEHFRYAVELSRDSSEAQQVHLASLNNLATVLGQQGHYRDASEAFKTALSIAEARLGPWHPTVGSTNNNLGVSYSQLGEHELAMQYTGRAIQIYEKVLRGDHPELGRGYHNLGVSQAALGWLDEAHASYRRALEIKTRSLGPDNVSVAFSANNVGDSLLELGRPAEALPYLEDALRIWTETQGPENPNNMYALIGLADAYLALDRSEKAVPIIRRALELGETGNIDPIQRAETDFIAARVLAISGEDRNEAITLAERARARYQASERPSSKELAEIDHFLAAHK